MITRKESVAEHIESSHVLHLDLLSDEVCWSILSQNAFAGRVRRGDLIWPVGLLIGNISSIHYVVPIITLYVH